MKILLIGKNGQLGWELNRSLLHLGHIIALDRSALDLSQTEDLRNKINEIRPDVIVNAAAYTAVDRAEEDESLAMAINGTAPGILAEESKRHNALLIHFSTDYVFDGAKEGAYTEDDEPAPVNAYGRSKLAGEQAIQLSGCDYLIFRTSWVYASRGNNFLLTILKLVQERDSISVVGDQFGSPTWAKLIAGATCHCVFMSSAQRQSGQFNSGLFHLTSSGSTTWHGFAEAIVDTAADSFELLTTVGNIVSIPTTEFPTPAMRPKNSILSSSSLEGRFGIVMPDWKECLQLCIEELK